MFLHRAARLLGPALPAASAHAPVNAARAPAPKPEPLPTRYLATEGGQLAYDDSGGPGPLVVAVPGMGDLRSEYRALRPLLRAAGYRVVTLDVRGFGESSAQWDDLSARAVGRDVQRLIRHLNAGAAVVLGNSFAAGSALWAAREAPSLVRGAVLLGPIVRDGEPNALVDRLVRLGFAGPWRVRFWMGYWNSLFPSRKPLDHDQAAAALEANLREPGRMDALRTMVALRKTQTEAIVRDTRVRALVVMGTRDPDFKHPAREARWLAHALQAQALLIDGAGHYPHLERADAVAPALLRFLREVAPTPGIAS